MELSQIRYFSVLAKQQHFTRAAETLHITQPALSKAISNLEKELGVELFDRVGKQIFLNSAGQMFLAEITPILGDLEDVKTRMADLSLGVHGELSIGATFPVETSSVIQNYLRNFVREHPAVSQRTYMYDQARIENLLIEYSLEFGLTLSMPNKEGIRWNRLLTERLGIVVGKSHPLAKRKTIRLAEVANERFLCNISAPDDHDSARFICKMAGYIPNVVYEGNDTPLISQLVAEGYGVTMMPEEKYYEYRVTTGEPIWQKDLCYLHVEEEFCQRPIYLLYRDRQHESAMIQAFKEGLIAHIEQQRH